MKSKTNVSVVFMQLCLLFAVAFIASNLFETKQIAAGPIHITGVFFPIAFPGVFYRHGAAGPDAIPIHAEDSLRNHLPPNYHPLYP